MSLSPNEQALLDAAVDLLAVSQGFVLHGFLERSLVELGLEASPREMASALAALRALPDVTRDYGATHARMPFVERRCRELAGTPRYGEVYRALAAIDPRYGTGGYTEKILRDLRWAMLEGDADEFCSLALRARVNLAHWVSMPFDEAFVLSSPGPIAGTLVSHVTLAEWRHQVELGPVEAVTRQLLEDHPDCHEVRMAAARRALLVGDVGVALAMVEDADTLEGRYLAAWATLQRGDVKGSVKRYAKVLSDHRKVAGRGALPTGPEGSLLVLAYLLDGTATRRKQAAALCRTAHDQTPGLDWTASPYRAASELCVSLEGGDPPPLPPGEDHHPLAVLIDTLHATWTDQPPPEEADHAATEAEALGWRWLATEIRAALGAPTPGTDVRHLVTHRETTPRWERQLAALEALAGKGAPSSEDDAAPSERICWVLTHFDDRWVDLEARQQKRTRKGWSAGRKVALSRLYEGAVDGITKDDQRLLKALRKKTSRSWRGYRQEHYEWAYDAVWPALIGHPSIVNGHREPLTISEQRPRITLRREGRRLTMELDPPLSEGRVQVSRSDDHHYLVTAFDKRQLQLAEQLGEGLEVPTSASSRVGRLVERFTATFDVHDHAAAADAHEAAADERLVIQLTPAGAGLLVRVRVRPLGPEGPDFAPGGGARSVLAHVAGRLCRTERDLEAERESANALPDDLPVLAAVEYDDHAYRLEAVEQALEFLLEARDYPDLVLEWPEGEGLRLRSEIDRSRMTLSVTGTDQWLKYRGTMEVDEDLVLDLVDVLGRLDAARGRFVELEDGSFVALTDALQRRLDAVKRASRTVKGVPQVHRLASPLVEALAEEAGSVRRNKLAKQFIEAFSAPGSTEGPPPTLHAELRAYQVEGLQWLSRMTALGAGVCLADDMGLGKTLQVLAWLLAQPDAGPTLVVAPTSVCGSWLEQAWRFAPTLEMARFGPGDRARMVEEAGPGQVVIASYGLLQSESELLASREWFAVVLDEAQAIKNSQTQRHRAATSLRAQHRIALTGTPVQNHLGELWSLFSFLNPGLLGTEKQFLQRFAAPIENGRREVAGQLRQLVLPFLLRRTKSAVLQDLPAKTEIAIEVEQGPDEAAFYEALRQKAMKDLTSQERTTTLQILEKLTQLRQAACSPTLVAGPDAPDGAKLDAFRGVVESLRANGHRALVFSQFVRHLAILREWLDDDEIPYQYLDGSTPTKQRDERVRAFQRGEGDLFLISLTAGGTGLNLTAADFVLHMDPWWNPAVEDQASDRAHRIGQTRPVTVYRFITKGTVEEQIAALHATKRDLSDRLLSGTDAAARLSPEQLMALLQQAHTA